VTASTDRVGSAATKVTSNNYGSMRVGALREYERAARDHLHGFCRFAILGETDEIQVVVVVGQHGFCLIAEIQEELNIPSGPQHRAGIELMGLGRGSFDLSDQGFPHPTVLLGRIHG